MTHMDAAFRLDRLARVKTMGPNPNRFHPLRHATTNLTDALRTLEETEGDYTTPDPDLASRDSAAPHSETRTSRLETGQLSPPGFFPGALLKAKTLADQKMSGWGKALLPSHVEARGPPARGSPQSVVTSQSHGDLTRLPTLADAQLPKAQQPRDDAVPLESRESFDTGGQFAPKASAGGHNASGATVGGHNASGGMIGAQGSENRRLRFDDDGLEAENRCQKVESGGHDVEDRGCNFEDRGSNFEDRGCNFEDRGCNVEDSGVDVEDRGRIFEGKGQSVEGGRSGAEGGSHNVNAEDGGHSLTGDRSRGEVRSAEARVRTRWSEMHAENSEGARRSGAGEDLEAGRRNAEDSCGVADLARRGDLCSSSGHVATMRQLRRIKVYTVQIFITLAYMWWVCHTCACRI